MTPSQRTTFTPEPAFIVRIAGMPMEALGRLRCDRTMRIIDEILAIEAWLGQVGEGLSEELYELIGGNEDKAIRRRLISLRRDAYLGRLPKGGKPDERLLAAMPSDLAARIEGWYAQVLQRTNLESKAEAVLAEELAEKRCALRDAAAGNAFRQGIALASQDLYPDLTRWVNAEGEPEEDRKLELRLAKYLARMAAKTSPYSTFTGFTEGCWSPDAGPTICCSAGSSRPGVVELNAYTLRQMLRSLAGWPEIRPQLMLKVNSSLLEDGEVLRFLGRQKQEAVLELTDTPTLRRFLDEVRGGDDRSYGGVVRALAGASGADRSEEIAAFLDKLIGIGLLELGFGIPDNALDPLGELVGALEPYREQRVEAMRALLSRLRADLDAYPRIEDASERFEQVGIIRRDLEEIYVLLGWDPTGDEFPKNAFYEDTLIAGADPRCSLDAWGDVLADLTLLQRLAGLYDRFLPGRHATAAFFADHYGTGATRPFLDFYRDFCREIREPAGWRQGYRVSGRDLLTCFEEPLPVPQVGLASLDEVAALQQRLREHIAEQPVDDCGVRRLDPGLLGEFVAAFPDFVGPIESMACYSQVIVRDGKPLVVLNELTSGFGRSRARQLRLDLLAGGHCFDHSAAGDRDSRRGRHAEIAGAAESNLNLRPPMTPYEIEYPGSVSGRPPDERVPLSDLLVVHDPNSTCLRLVSASRGEEVRPVHLGAMTEFLLPPAYRFLIQVFGQTVPRFEFLKELATASAAEESEGVRRSPRLCLGDVVINRAAWMVWSHDVPEHAKGQSAFDYMLAVHRWRREHEIPECCFVRAFSRERAESHRVTVAGILDKSRKPLYMDFASPYFLRAFEQVAQDRDRLLVIEEMLPDQGDLIVKDGERSYASELVFELTNRQAEAWT